MRLDEHITFHAKRTDEASVRKAAREILRMMPGPARIGRITCVSHEPDNWGCYDYEVIIYPAVDQVMGHGR